VDLAPRQDPDQEHCQDDVKRCFLTNLDRDKDVMRNWRSALIFENGGR